MSKETVKTLNDFMQNPDDYFSKKYPHTPLALYDSIEVAINALQQFEKIDIAIDEIQRVLLGNKSRDVEEIYLQNAIRYLNEIKTLTVC